MWIWVLFIRIFQREQLIKGIPTAWFCGSALAVAVFTFFFFLQTVVFLSG